MGKIVKSEHDGYEPYIYVREVETNPPFELIRNLVVIYIGESEKLDWLCTDHVVRPVNVCYTGKGRLFCIDDQGNEWETSTKDLLTRAIWND